MRKRNLANCKIKCELCGSKHETFKGLASHVARYHYPEYDKKIYYDTFLKKKNEGTCKICGKPTSFISLRLGYRTYCSSKCSDADIEVLNKIEKTKIDKYGGVFSDSPIILKKIERTNVKRTGYKNPFLDPKVQEQIRIDREERTGYKTAIQNPKIYRKIFRNKERSSAEKEFNRLLDKNKIEYSKEYFVKGEDLNHHFDFAIFKNNELKCLVEIDSEYYHGLLNDNPGNLRSTLYDFRRYELVPNKVKFLVIDSMRVKEGFKELQRILPMKYKTWKKEMLRSIPKNIKDAIPRFNKTRMLTDWDKLCTYSYSKGSFLGKSILLHFCRSHWNTLEKCWKYLRKTLYKSPCSEHHVLEGLDTFRNVSKLREKYRKKFANDDFVVFKHHSPEKMLAICSLGKTYVSKEPIDKESIRIIGFLNLKAYEEINDKAS